VTDEYTLLIISWLSFMNHERAHNIAFPLKISISKGVLSASLEQTEHPSLSDCIFYLVRLFKILLPPTKSTPIVVRTTRFKTEGSRQSHKKTMTNQYSTRYYPATKKDHDLQPEQISKNDADTNAKSDVGIDTNTHTHRYVPAQPHWKLTAAPVKTGHTSRYYPVTAKDLELNHEDILKSAAYQNGEENDGMDTNTHTSRYVPARAPRSKA
jgi:hypothetical protein